MPDKEVENTETSGGEIIFWILWVVTFIILPFYAFTLFFELSVIKEDNLGSQFSPVIGAAVFIAQIWVMVTSFKQMKRKLPLSKPYLTLLGGTILIGFVWAGGCAIMGPFNLH